MANLQKGFFRLTIVVSVITGLLFFLLSFEGSQRNVKTSFQRDQYEKYKAGDISYEFENRVLTYESDPNYYFAIKPHPKGFQKVVVFFKAFLFALLGATPYVLAVWVIYFTIRFVVTGFIGKNENT